MLFLSNVEKKMYTLQLIEKIHKRKNMQLDAIACKERVPQLFPKLSFQRNFLSRGRI